VIVNGGEWAVVRPRQEIEALIGADRLPPWLARPETAPAL
jgi:diaminopimelate decarboxylase